jgi:hypothetical protein
MKDLPIPAFSSCFSHGISAARMTDLYDWGKIQGYTGSEAASIRQRAEFFSYRIANGRVRPLQEFFEILQLNILRNPAESTVQS